MALYEYRCRICDERFEVRRPMNDAAKDATCPDGHDDTVRLVTSFATAGIGANKESASPGCCGGKCGCAN